MFAIKVYGSPFINVKCKTPFKLSMSFGKFAFAPVAGLQNEPVITNHVNLPCKDSGGLTGRPLD